MRRKYFKVYLYIYFEIYLKLLIKYYFKKKLLSAIEFL